MKIWSIKGLCDVLAIIGNVGGAILVALSQKYPTLGIAGYLFFLIGSLSSIWLLSHSTASKSLILINVYFTIVNVIGIVARVKW